MVGELERQFKKLRQGAHLCHVCTDAVEQRAVLVPFFRDGLTAGERCVCAADLAVGEALLDALRASGVDVERERRRGALTLLSPRDTYLRSGFFDPRATLDLLCRLREQARADGFAGLRAAGDMTWAADDIGSDRLLQYEILLNEFLARLPTLVLCQYARTRFEPAILLDVLRTHPLIVLDGEVCPNLYYEPPDLLSPLGQASSLSQERRRVDWILGQLQHARAAERERERLLEQLYVQSARLESIVQQMPAGVLITEAPSGKIVLANEQLGRISGRTPQHGESLDDYRDWQSFHPDGRPYQVREWPLLRAMNGESVSDVEMVIRHPAGGQTTICVNAAPIRDAAGNIVAAAVIIHDITTRKQAEDALRASEQRYRLLFERNLAAVCRSTQEGQILDCNEAFAHLFGFASPAEAMSQPAASMYFQPADREAYVTALCQARELTNHEMCMRRKDGSPVWVLANSALVSDAAGRVYLEGTFVDISARKQVEEATLLSAARYRSLIEQLGEGIFLKDRNLRFVLANKAFCRNMGCSEASLIGRTAADFYPNPLVEAFEADDRHVLTHGERVEREQTLTVEGKPRLVRIIKTPVLDERAQVVGVLGIAWDVTEQRDLESQLRQAQKMEAIGLLAGGIAHDFNNLLAVILGNIALSLGGLSERHPNRDLLYAAERAGVQASELTNRLLGFARQTILRPAPVQLKACMEETASLLRRTIDPLITLEVMAPENLWTVEADVGQMNQVLMNLCLNARDAMPTGGRLTLEAVNIVIDEKLVRQHVAAQCGEFVRLRVSDTGHGIPPEIRSRIFEPFFTTKSIGKGTGLGLAMVYGIVQQHHGWIDCISEVGKGTHFDIYLPRQGILVPVGATTREDRPAPRGGRETILLADDEPMIRTLGLTILQRYGYRVILAEDGVDAVATYQQRQAEINLVILDLTMPRLSGHDALHQLLQLNPQVCVLLASGYSAEQLDESLSDQIAGFLTKPYRPEKLAQTVREALDRRRHNEPRR